MSSHGFVKKILTAVKCPAPDDEQSEMSDLDIENDNDGLSEDEVEQYCDPPTGFVRLRPSKFQSLPATVFFEYPLELGIKRRDLSTLEDLGSRKLFYRSYWERICIHNAFKRAGFSKSDKLWTAMWAKHQNQTQMKELNCLQKVNHFPASWCIGRKDRLSRTLNTMRRIHGSVFDFHPESFILPNDKDNFLRQLKSDALKKPNSNSEAGGFWIVKPCASSCGRGIKVLTCQQAEKISMKKKIVVQRYLMRPYLIDGKKFDLRIYVLVTGVDPLRVYIHDEGLTRISTANYSLKNIGNQFAHLTNYSINKKAAVFKAAPVDGGSSTGKTTVEDAPTDNETEGFKWSLNAFRRWLTKKEGKKVMETTFDRIFDLCLKTMIAAESEITPHLHQASNYRTNCFELFGCDVILDSNLNPHLLEVNVSPSLMGSSPLDKKIKGTVIADMLHIVGIYPHDSRLLKKYSRPQSAGLTGPREPNIGDDNNMNPFAYTSLSKMMASQESYRRDPCANNVDIAALGSNESSWLLLLMIEDELSRAMSTKFHVVHPTPNAASYYTTLYRNCRFSDHLLAKWVQSGGSEGEYSHFIPTKFVPNRVRVAKTAASKSRRYDSPTKSQHSAAAADSTPVSSKTVNSTPRPQSAGRSGIRSSKQELVTTPITISDAVVPSPDLPSKLRPPSQLSQRRLVQSRQEASPESILRRDWSFSNGEVMKVSEVKKEEPPVIPSLSAMPDVLVERLSSFGFKPVFVDSPLGKKQSYLLFNTDILQQQTALSERFESLAVEKTLSTEMIINFVNSKHSHSNNSPSKTVHNQREDDDVNKTISKSHHSHKEPKSSLENSDQALINETEITEENFILKGKYSYKSPEASPSSRERFNPFASRRKIDSDSGKEKDQFKYELLMSVGQIPKSPSIEQLALQRSGAWSLVKPSNSPIMVSPDELYNMNEEGILDVFRSNDLTSPHLKRGDLKTAGFQSRTRSRSNPPKSITNAS